LLNIIEFSVAWETGFHSSKDHRWLSTFAPEGYLAKIPFSVPVFPSQPELILVKVDCIFNFTKRNICQWAILLPACPLFGF
jgi:hypothetical protein